MLKCLTPTRDAERMLIAAMVALLARPSVLSVWEWLEEYVTLSERESNAEPGRFSTRTRPYMRAPLEDFRDKRVTDIVLCFGTQTGKTMTVMGGALWVLCNTPMNGLWVMPNRDLAKSFTANRWLPFVESSPLKDQKPTDRHLYTRLEQVFTRATLSFVGSNSPANLASRPAGLLLMDETDKFELKSDREAGALQNAEERTKSFPYPKKVKTSTPSTKFGEIWQEFLRGDQRYFYLPCPRCDQKIRLMWAQVRWWDKDPLESKIFNEETQEWEWDMDKVRANTFYRCQKCEGKIRDSEKTVMLRAGEWVAHNKAALTGRKSYHLNSLYAPLKEAQWGNLAVKWLQTKGSITRRHAFINSTLAEPWDDEMAIDDEPVNLGSYDPAQIGKGMEGIPLMTVDVQDTHYWVVVRLWGSPRAEGGQQSWLLFAGKIETVEELEALPERFKVKPRHVGIDIAHKTNFVSALIVKNGWRGLWGSEKVGFPHPLGQGQRVMREFSTVQYRDPNLGTPLQGRSEVRAMYIFWSNDRIKDRLAVLRSAMPGRWHIYAEVPVDYVKQMNSEIKTTKVSPKTGRVTYYWRRVKVHNHCWDCEAENIALGIACGVIEDDIAMSTNSQAALALAPAPEDY